MNKPEAFGVIWDDLLLGPLSLKKDNAADAIEAAIRIREKGEGKVENVRAVHVRAGSDSLEYLD